MRAMVFAAGMGTRLKSLTANRPKALVEVEGQPLLEHVLNKLHRESVSNVVVNVHHFPDQVIDFISRYPYKDEMHIQVSDERSLLLDTGGGLRKAFPLFLNMDATSPILIHNVDILSNVCLHHLYNACNGHDAVLLVSKRETSRYLLFDDEMKMVGWINIQTGEVKSPFPNLDPTRFRRLAFAGIHAVAPSIGKALDRWPEVFGITDFYIRECSHLDIRGFIQPDLQLLDVGKPDTLERAASFLHDNGLEQAAS